MTPRCPLCLNGRRRPSWLGVRRSGGSGGAPGKALGSQCSAGTQCGSSYYNPMPDEAVLRRVYGAEYLGVNQPGDAPGSPKNHAWVVRELARRPAGVFIDYGCGAGDLLVKASRLGWDARGVELNEDVAARVAGSIGLPVTSEPESLARSGTPAIADVVHTGDVLEHFLHLDRELDRVLGLLKPGGVLMAQGPLMSGACVFNAVYKTAGRLRSQRVIDAPPTHLVASTRDGVQHLIARRRLDVIEFAIDEVAWPGPWRWEAHAKAAALFALRRVSQSISRRWPARLGNRYRFAAVKGS